MESDVLMTKAPKQASSKEHVCEYPPRPRGIFLCRPRALGLFSPIQLLFSFQTESPSACWAQSRKYSPLDTGNSRLVQLSSNSLVPIRIT